MFAYIRSIKTANRVATVSITFDWIIIAVNLGVWVAAVIVYKNEKDKVEAGVHNDLWGWSCSDAAAKIQGPFNGVLNFGRLCNVQVRENASRFPVNSIPTNDISLVFFMVHWLTPCGILGSLSHHRHICFHEKEVQSKSAEKDDGSVIESTIDLLLG